jgi:O-antigen/teichoic acid export membrane protein
VASRQIPPPRQTGLGNRLIANTLCNIFGQVYAVLLGLAVIPYLVHRLGAGLYGLVAVVAALGGFAGLLNLGIGRALSKYVAELYWQGEFSRINSLVRTALTVAIVAGCGGCALLFLFRGFFSEALVHGDRGAASYVGFAVLITAVGVLIALPLDPLAALPAALQRFDISNRMGVLLSTVRNAGAVAALALGFFFRGILIVHLLAGVVALVGYGYYGKKLVPGLRLRPGLNRADLKRLIGFSAPVLFAGVGALAVHKLDRVLVAYFLPIAAVAFYVIPYALAERIGLGVGNITSVIFPSASELCSMGAEAKIQELYVRATKMVLLAAMPATAVLLAIPSQLLRFWVGPQYAERGALTLQLLAGGFLFNILAHVPYVMAQAIDRPWISAKYSLLNGLGNLALFLVLIPRYGIVGAGAGFLAAEAAIMPMFVWEMNRLLNIPCSTVILESYSRPLACGAVATLLLWLCRGYADSAARLVLMAGLALAAFAVLAVLGAVDRQERDGIRAIVAQGLRLRRDVANA